MRWKPGDVYAIPMPDDTKEECNIDQKTPVYVLINCVEIVNDSSKNQEITAYILLHIGELEGELSDIIANSIVLPAGRAFTGRDIFLYRYYFLN